MAKNTPAGRLIFTATQGSADAFVQAEVETGLNQVGIGGKIAYRILEIGVQFQLMVEVDSWVGLSLTRQSMSALPNMNERSLIYKETRQVAITTSGQMYVPDLVSRWQPLEAQNLIIVENPIYVQVDSDGTSNANTVYGYVLYEQVAITETERLALIAQSLGS